MNDSPAILTRSLTKSYGQVEALCGLDLEVQRGEIFGFLGPNGAGKTTTIRCLLDLIRPDGGTASVLGLDPQTDPVAVRSRVGYLPGELNLEDNLTGRKILRYFSALRGHAVDWDGAHVLAERLSLGLDQPVKNLSKGNKQKIGLVQALMHKPELLLLDEPTSGLDPEDIAGLVFIDPTDVFMTREEEIAVMESFGSGEADYDALQATMREFFQQAPPNIRTESEAITAFQQSSLASRAIPSLPDVPLAVLLSVKVGTPPPGMSLPFDFDTWQEAATDFRLARYSDWVRASPEATLVVATHAAHYMHRDDPALVIEAVRRVTFPNVGRQLARALSESPATLAETYRQLTSYYPATSFTEDLLNTLGYQMLAEERVQDAIAIFELNVAEYPEVANPYDSLGEAYERMGRLEGARRQYERAVALGAQHPSVATFQENLDRVTDQLDAQ